MKKNNLTVVLLLNLLLVFSFLVKAQDIPLKVTDGILYTVNGKWGDGMLLHYSKSKYGINYKANLKIKPGKQTLEYFFKQDEQVYEITFTAKPNNKYFVYNQSDKPVVKENKTILSGVSIENISSKSGNDSYQIVPGIIDTSQVAILLYDSDNDYFSKYKRPVFILRKIDSYWGDGSTGNISGRFNDIRRDEFKVKMPPGEHKLYAQLNFGSYYLLAITDFTYNFEAGKIYTIVFDNLGLDPKKRVSELQMKMILGSARIVEVTK